MFVNSFNPFYIFEAYRNRNHQCMLKQLLRKKPINKIMEDAEKGHGSQDISLRRTLGVRDLTSFGIAAIIGAGIFSTIGKASADGGPAVIFLFMFTALACS